MSPAPLLGLLLAGGRSTRMGGDKAVLEIDGEPLWRRQARTLRAIGAVRIVVSRQADQPALPGLEAIPDAVANLGPIAGLHAALALRSATHVAALAVDLPDAAVAWFGPLLAASAPGCGAVYHSGTYFEPLAAIYPAEAESVCARRIAADKLSLQGLCTELVGAGLLRSVPLPAELSGGAENLNTPGDLLRWTSTRGVPPTRPGR